MCSQYDTKISKSAARAWGASRNTHEAIAMAIHAITDSHRSAQAIWEAPTEAELDHVAIAVENYIANGIFEAEEDGRYMWGGEAIKF